jgi:hypothetical protein
MPLLVTLAELRDVVIVVWGVISAIFFLVAIFVVALLGFSVKGLLNNVKGMMDESVKPTLTSVKDAADTVRGTTEFVGRTAVTPVVRAYGTVAGVKKGLGVLTGIKGKK